MGDAKKTTGKQTAKPGTKAPRLMRQILRMADGNNGAAAEMLGCQAGRFSLWVNGNASPTWTAIYLARRLVKEAGAKPAY